MRSYSKLLRIKNPSLLLYITIQVLGPKTKNMLLFISSIFSILFKSLFFSMLPFAYSPSRSPENWEVINPVHVCTECRITKQPINSFTYMQSTLPHTVVVKAFPFLVTCGLRTPSPFTFRAAPLTWFVFSDRLNRPRRWQNLYKSKPKFIDTSGMANHSLSLLYQIFPLYSNSDPKKYCSCSKTAMTCHPYANIYNLTPTHLRTSLVISHHQSSSS